MLDGAVDRPDTGVMFRSIETLIRADDESSMYPYPYAGAGESVLVRASRRTLRGQTAEAFELHACVGATFMVGAGCMPNMIMAACAAAWAILVRSSSISGGGTLSSFALLLRSALSAHSSFVRASVSASLGLFGFGFCDGAVSWAVVGRAGGEKVSGGGGGGSACVGHG